MTEFIRDSLVEAYKAIYRAVNAVDTQPGHDDLREDMRALLERLEEQLLPGGRDELEEIWGSDPS